MAASSSSTAWTNPAAKRAGGLRSAAADWGSPAWESPATKRAGGLRSAAADWGPPAWESPAAKRAGGLRSAAADWGSPAWESPAGKRAGGLRSAAGDWGPPAWESPAGKRAGGPPSTTTGSVSPTPASPAAKRGPVVERNTRPLRARRRSLVVVPSLLFMTKREGEEIAQAGLPKRRKPSLSLPDASSHTSPPHVNQHRTPSEPSIAFAAGRSPPDQMSGSFACPLRAPRPGTACFSHTECSVIRNTLHSVWLTAMYTALCPAGVHDRLPSAFGIGQAATALPLVPPRRCSQCRINCVQEALGFEVLQSTMLYRLREDISYAGEHDGASLLQQLCE